MDLAALLALIVRLATLTVDELGQMAAGVAEVLGAGGHDEATQLRDALRTAYAEVRAADDAALHVDALRAAVEADGAVTARFAELEADAQRIADELAALDAQMSDTPADDDQADEVETEQEVPAPADPANDPALPHEDEQPAADTEDADEQVPVAAAAAPAPARTRPRAASPAAAAPHVPAAQRSRAQRRRERNRMVSMLGFEAGNELEGGLDQAIGLMQQRLRSVSRVSGGDTAMLPVARIEADFAEDRWLDHDTDRNMERIRAAGAGSPDALVAAGGVCVPAEPYYGVAQISTDDRPVRAAMTNFGAARGGITWIPPKSIADYSGGVMEWTNTLDQAVSGASSATWKNSLSITCGTPTSVTLRGVPAIMETGVMYERTHPEAARADMANLLAYHARLAESLLLRDIRAGSTKTTAQSYGSNTPVGATRDTLFYVGAMAENIRNRHRLPAEARLDWIAPSFLRRAIQADLALQQPGDDALDAALAEIQGYLEARGVNAYWYLDDPGAGHSQYFTAPSANGTTPLFPVQAQWGLYPEGTWLFLDGGSLDLGVTRDFDQQRQNKFGFFAETFEGAAMVGVESQWVTQIVSVAGGFGTGEDLGS